MRLGLLVLPLALFAACGRSTTQEAESRAPAAESNRATPTAVAPVPLSDKISRPEAAHLVAIGDLHGDLDHTRRVLRLAGAIDEHDGWAGGAMTVVQTGDEIDRGDGDKAILDLVESLKVAAKKSGGEFIALLGNHEIMNASQDFRYVTPGGSAAFSLLGGRAAAFAPGGPYAQILAKRPLFVKVGSTVFVHGGILPKHIDYGLDKMNDEVSDWLLGKKSSLPEIVSAEDAPVWTRAYSNPDAPPDCDSLGTALAKLGAKRMVVGHTVQKTDIAPACDGKVFRIDTGMSSVYGGPIEALAIDGDKIAIKHE